MPKRVSRSIRPSQCQTCQHPERAQIEALRLGGASFRALSARFGIGKDALFQHMRHHVTNSRKCELIAGPAKVEELANQAAGESRSLLEQLSIVRSVLLNRFLNAAEAGDNTATAGLSGRLLESLRELGKLTGELRQISGVTVNNNTLNITASPQYARLQEGLVQIYRAHPQARDDIVALLRGLDAPPAKPALALERAAGPPLIECEAAVNVA